MSDRRSGKDLVTGFAGGAVREGVGVFTVEGIIPGGQSGVYRPQVRCQSDVCPADAAGAGVDPGRVPICKPVPSDDPGDALAARAGHNRRLMRVFR